MNAIENIVKMVTELKKELEEMPETKEAKPVSRRIHTAFERYFHMQKGPRHSGAYGI